MDIASGILFLFQFNMNFIVLGGQVSPETIHEAKQRSIWILCQNFNIVTFSRTDLFISCKIGIISVCQTTANENGGDLYIVCIGVAREEAKMISELARKQF